MHEPQRYLVTAALPYANGPLHIGHLAGAYLPADIFVRYLRMRGKDVIFICGSDEHGVPITLRAKKEGITPQQVVDKYHQIIKESFEKFGIQFNNYSRTSNKIHHQTASEFFKTLYHKNVFTEEITEQFFDEKANQFLADRYIAGTCPKCANPNAYGDQCEKCGTSLSPDELIEPKSTLSGEKPVKKKTKNWFLPLDRMQSEIGKYIESHKDDWKANVFGQCKSWLNEGLKPRAMTRDLDWGVKVPLQDAEGKALYVWFDAPIGYMSATKELLPNGWENYWCNQESRLIHFIGKDNIVFHCIIFPAMLMSHGGFILPAHVPANEFLNLEGDKISTSRNWAVWLHEYLQDFPGREDELRYVLCSIAPETKDSEFTWKDYRSRVNNELADILGNYVKRVVDLMHRFFNAEVAPITEKEVELLSTILQKAKLEKQLEGFHFREALCYVIDAARSGNKYLSDTEPWKLFKTNPDETKRILCFSLQLIANISILIEPFLPNTSRKILKTLNLDETFLKWENIGNPQLLPAGHKINKAEILFPKIEDSEIQKQVQKLHDSKMENLAEVPNSKPQIQSPVLQAPSAKPQILYDDFSKIDIRTGTILSAEKVEKADKLLKLQIDTGIDTRTIVSGIAQYYKPEEIIGQKVCVLLNLASRKIKGIESQGMILMAENAIGKLAFIAPTKDVENGSEIS